MISRLQTYIHHNGQIAVIVEARCQTDFCANTEVFRDFHKQVCLQIASMENPPEGGYTKEFLDSRFIFDLSKNMSNVIDDISVNTGEKISIGFIVRRSVIPPKKEGRTSTDAATV